ncbi:hypothetical protein KR067_006566 [Drosophila pandora]|nr:hypothetical protein KR067_006566 [Drosophila pandora]
MQCRKKSNVFFIDDVNSCMAGLKSATKEALELGAKTPETYERHRHVSKKIVNFRSLSSKQYPEMAASGIPPPKVDPPTSVYSHDYSCHLRRKMKPPCNVEDVLPDPEFCRRPINVFYMLPSSRFKFMDDHLKTELVPEGRKKIDFFRQIR